MFFQEALHSDFDTSGEYEVYENTPLPVVCLSPDIHVENLRKQIQRVIDFLYGDKNSIFQS